MTSAGRVVILYDRTGLVKAEIRAAIGHALHEITEDLLHEANKTIPLETGTMMRSGQTEVDGLSGQVSYDTPYAVYQHEDASLHHDPGRRDHWLLKAGDENQRRYANRVAETVRAVAR
jgi:hypothetical protein